MKVSVIMPAYNAEKHIGKAIQSILNQTFQDFELIIIDDGSTDSTIKKINSHQSNKIKLMHTAQNTGAAGARNLGISVATGEYIAFLDADDWAYPERLERQVDFLDKNPHIGLLGSWIEVVNEEGQLVDEFVWEIEQTQIAPRLLFHNCFATSSVAVRKEFAVYYFDSAYPPAEDYELWMRLSTKTQFGIIREKLIKYLAHSQGISKLQKEKMEKNVLQILLNGLANLGIKPTEKEIILHKQIAHLDFQANKNFLLDANQWLLKLKEANEDKKIFPHKNMNDLLAYYWFRLCVAHHFLGIFTLFSFLNSPLRKYLPMASKIRLSIRCMLSGISKFSK